MTENEPPNAESSEIATAPGSTPRQSGARFPVVAFGASAGGLEALLVLLSLLSEESGMAFVVIQHLDPERPSMLTKVLGGGTRLSVVEATTGMALEPDRVHVIPSNADLTVRDGILTLVPRHLTGRLHLPIDTFFRSLAKDAKDRAIGVILSGSGADGIEGLRAIRAEGGIACVQEPASAQFPSMPKAAIKAGLVDICGSPAAIASELTRLSLRPHVAIERAGGDATVPNDGQEKSCALILAALRQHGGADFSGYKRTTLLRRIRRRMALRKIDGLDTYAASLSDHPEEARMLAQEMLINVTSFFRNPQAFESLQEKVFDELARSKADGDSIRIWVPGCSTGEEVYALAICLLESLGARAEKLAIKIFGTDLSEKAIATARIGSYSEAALVDLAPERVSRFFDHLEGSYQISEHIRDLCLFVKHDLNRDPPFAKVDVISCRNILIYFDAELQRQIIPMLHHCLNKNGHLFLGRSEAIVGFGDLFAPVDKQHRIFVKTGESRRIVYPLPVGRRVEGKVSAGRIPSRHSSVRDAQRQADQILLTRFAPPGVLVNERLEIVQFCGRTGAYLEQPPGQPQANLLRMAREDLVAHVHEAIERAKSQSASVRKQGLQIQVGTERRVIDLEVVPLAHSPESSDRYFLVLFAESGTRTGEGTRHPVSGDEPEPPAESVAEIHRLKAELAATKDYLQSLIGEHQTITKEVAATNEEMVATNEELQSANEELQSANEELQSAQEELSTVNDQLRIRNQELDQVASDLENVLASVELPVVIVDLELRLRRFTPAVTDIARFIPKDIGRPIDDLKLKLQVDDLPSRIRATIDGKVPREWEVQRQDGHWFRMHIRPYRTTDDRLDGAVLVFLDVDVLKQARKEAESTRDYARNIVETVTTALVVLNSSLAVLSANAAFLQRFSVAAAQIEGKRLLEIEGLWAMPAVREMLEDSITNQTPFSAFEIKAELPDIGHRVLSLTGRLIPSGGVGSMMLLAIDDVTDLRVLEAERELLLASEKQARHEAERANQAKDVFLATLSHELRTPLSTILMSAQLLKQISTEDSRIVRASDAIERATQAQALMIDELLDVSRIVSGKLLLDLGPVDFEAVVQSAIDVARPAAQAKSLELVAYGASGTVRGDALRLQQIANNLLTNAIKFTPPGGRITARLERIGAHAQLSVSDTGMGIRPEVMALLFNRFVQADSSVTRIHGGLGLGLSIVRHLVEAHGGSVRAESAGEGEGATFRVMVPLGDAETSTVVGAPQASVRGIAGVRVLVIEDDDDIRDVYAEMLAEFGAEVRTAASVAGGFLAIAEFHPEAILCDIAMPGEHGFSFARRLRQLPPEQGGLIPAAALTALASNEDLQRSLDAGFQLHVRKPVNSARLESVVATLAAWSAREDMLEASSAGSGQGDESVHDTAEPPASNSEKIAPLRIMVVEDDHLIAMTLQELLRNRGHDARCVSDGEAALALNRTFQPEVALIDIGLPIQNGYDVARRLRDECKDRSALLVALTGSEEDRSRLEQASFDRYLRKPVGIHEISAILGEWDRGS